MSKRWRTPTWFVRWQRLTQRDPSRRAVFAAYRRAQRQLKSYRGEAQTVGEHAQVAPELSELAELVEIAAYRPEPPDAGMVQKAKDLTQRRKGAKTQRSEKNLIFFNSLRLCAFAPLR